MIKFHPTCKVCSTIKLEPKLADRIYKTTAYDPRSKISLAELQRMYEKEFSYESLKAHTKKHQAISEKDLQDRRLKEIVKKAEAEVVQRKLESKDVWQEVMDIGMEELKAGNIKLKVSDMLRAAKDKTDYDLKVKDQELAMIEMVYHFASGENNAPIRGKVYAKSDRKIIEAETVSNIHPAEESPGDTGEGEDRPSGVYYPPTWDASTFGAGEVPERDY